MSITRVYATQRRLVRDMELFLRFATVKSQFLSCLGVG